MAMLTGLCGREIPRGPLSSFASALASTGVIGGVKAWERSNGMAADDCRKDGMRRELDRDEGALRTLGLWIEVGGLPDFQRFDRYGQWRLRRDVRVSAERWAEPRRGAWLPGNSPSRK